MTNKALILSEQDGVQMQVTQAGRRLGQATIPGVETLLPIRTLEIELTESLPEISLLDADSGQRYAAARCLVRLHSQPLGLVELKSVSPILKPTDVARGIWGGLSAPISEHLWSDGLPPLTGLSTWGLKTMGVPKCLCERSDFLANPPSVSVILCTHDRPNRLSVCISALTQLAYPRYEIIIVDNAPSTDSTAGVVREYQAGYANIHYIRENHPNLSLARNRGLAIARSEIIAFTDDDTVPDPHWLTEVARAFSLSPEVGCVTGLVLARELETPSQIWFEAYGGFSKGFVRKIYDLGEHRPADPLFPYNAGRFGTGANCSFRASVLRSLGGFDPAIGMGSKALNADDLDMFFRVLQAGYQLVYEPAALLYHSHRADYESLRRQIYTYNVGMASFLTKRLVDRPRIVLDLLGKLPYGLYYTLSGNSVKNKNRTDHYPADLLKAELKGLLYGCFSLAYLRSRWHWSQIRRSVLSAAVQQP